MTGARNLLINGRFLAGPQTAVNAVAAELTAALARAEGDAGGDWRIRLLTPPGLAGQSAAGGPVAEGYGRRDGIAWEQMELPRARREGVVAGFFNTVPLRGRGYVTMVHDAHVFTAPGSYGRATGAWRRLLSRRAGARGNYILTVSEHSRQALLGLGIGAPERIGVVHNGLGAVGRAAPDAGVLRRLGLEDGAPYCVALANLMPHKNVGLLLRAFADPALAHVRLVLVGNADAAGFAAAGHPPPDNALFAGFVGDAELAALYDRALAVCLPSTEEGFGLPALEGMARGAVALVADRGALPEVVGEAGIVLPPHDPRAWIEAVTGLVTAPERRAELATRGRTRAEGFTWDNAARAALGHLDRWFGGR